MCEIYDLAKPDEMRGVIDRQSILRLANFPAMLDEFSRSTIVVALIPTEVVGFAGFMGSPTGSVLNWLYVHPDARRVGVASALVTHLLETLSPPVRLNAVVSNASARAV